MVSRALARRHQTRYATAEESGQAVTEVPLRRVQHLAELPLFAADATRVAMPDVLPRTKDSLMKQCASVRAETDRLAGPRP